MKNIITIICMFITCTSIGQRDTSFTFTVKVPVDLQYKTIRDTVVIHDTIYLPAVAKLDTVRSSEYKSISAALPVAISKKALLFVDKSEVNEKINLIDTSVSIVFAKGVSVVNKASPMFLIRGGDINFDNITIRGDSSSVFASSDISKSIFHQWHVTLSNSSLKGIKNAFSLFRGGVGCYLKIVNSSLLTGHVSASVYNQNGSDGFAMISRKSVYKSDTSHGWYHHPNVNIDSENDTIMTLGPGVSGKYGISVHHYSGGGVPGVAKYVRYKNLYSPTGVEFCNNDGKFIEPKEGIVIDSSSINLYNSVLPKVAITNSHIFWGFMSGTMFNCTADKFYPCDSTYIYLSRFPKNEIDLQQGGYVYIRDSEVASILSSKVPVKPINLVLYNSNVKQWSLPSGAKATLTNTLQPAGLWGWKPTDQIISILK